MCVCVDVVIALGQVQGESWLMFAGMLRKLIFRPVARGELVIIKWKPTDLLVVCFYAS